MKKLLLLLLAPVLLFGCTEKTTTTDADGNSETIVLGGIEPLTGDAAVYGILAKNTVDLRLKQINEAGGINGKQVSVIWEDGKCNPKDATQATQKLVNVDKVSVILGGGCSGETLAAAPITEAAKVILFSSVSTSPDITNSGDFVFRTTPSDSSQGKVLAQYANKKEYKKVGIISEQTDYAVALARTFEAQFQGETIKEEYISTESDFKTRITKLKNDDIQALFINSQSPAKFEIIAKQLQEQNWELPIFANEVATANTETLLKFKELFDKTTLVGANFVAPEDNKALDKFLSEYKKEFGEEAPYANYLSTTVDQVNILKQVLETTQTETDTKKIRDGLYGIKNFEGMSGNISMDENGDVNIVHALFKFDGKKMVLLEE